MSNPGFLEIGKIVKTHGLQGHLKAVSYCDSEGLLRSLKEVTIEWEGGKRKPFALTGIRIRKGSFLLQLEGVENIEEAESLVGGRIIVPREQWEKLPEGEYYWEELLGLTVLTEEGRFLGRITSVFPTGSNDVYVCSEGEREIMLPATHEVIRNVDVAGGIMMVRLLEGL